jgi:hypothetical protein
MHSSGIVARLGAIMILCWPLAVSAQWKTTHFEVFFGEPWFMGNPNLTSIGRLVDENLFDLDEALDRPGFVTQATVDEIEQYLHETALRLEAMGFDAPELEPVVEREDGQPAYRIYLFDMDSDTTARYANGCHGGKVRRLIEVDLEAGAGSDHVIDGAGNITEKGYQDLAHELFHAVQAAYPIFTDDCSLGDWITEGTAQAVGNDTARVLRNIDPRNLSALGVRRYYEPLRVADDPPCLSTSANRLGCAGTNNGYWTASFWRYLGEMKQQNGSFPSTSFVDPDYAYLHDFFSRRLDGAPSESAELAWLDANLAGPKGFTKRLNRVFSTFITTFAAYPRTRLARSGQSYTGREAQWLDLVFGGCPEIVIDPTGSPAELDVSLDTVASACLRVSADIGGPLAVQVTAHPQRGASLPDLWVGTHAGQAVGRSVLVQVQNQGFAEWLFRMEAAPGESTIVVISNVAGDAEKTAPQTVNLRLTASLWSKSLGTP